MALRMADQCPEVDNAYSVGCVIVGADGALISTGFSREDGGRCHAEQSAFDKIGDKAVFQGADLYSTMEPCGARDSHPECCADMIIRHGIKRVFSAVGEPTNFKICVGTQKLQAAGIKVIYMPRFAAAALAQNAHIVAPAAAQPSRVCRHS